jgi:DNA-binding transcriptional LysR family regulator
MIQLHRLEGFRLVANAGGYARAARAAPYPITQPALHQQVRKLEREIGLSLLERVGKDCMRPTAAGRLLLDFVEPYFRDLPGVLRSLQRGEFAGSLSIHAEPLLIRQLLPGWLVALRRQHPGARVDLRELHRDDVTPLRTGEADVLVAHLPEIPDDLDSKVIGELRPFVVLPRGHESIRGKRLDLGILAEETFLSYPAGSRAHGLQLRALHARGLEPRRLITLDTADTILGFVESGLGYSIVPSLAAGGPTGRRLVSFRLPRPKVSFPVVAAWRRGAPANPLLAAFLDHRPS